MTQPLVTRDWADVEEDDFNMAGPGSQAAAAPTRIESLYDENGIKTVTEYYVRDGQQYKAVKKVQRIERTRMSNAAMDSRKNLAKFGKALEPNDFATTCRAVDDDVMLEYCKKPVVTEREEDKYLEEDLTSMLKPKSAQVWKAKFDRDGDDGPKDEGLSLAEQRESSNRYVPPGAFRARVGFAADDRDQFSLKVSNLSEDVTDGDLQELFAKAGRVKRASIIKNKETNVSRGFGFVDFSNRQDCETAIKMLNGHGYDNLILKVAWAKPQVQEPPRR